MTIRESSNSNGYSVSIDLSAEKGDRVCMFERNHNQNDVPLAIFYSLGVDFDLQTDAEKRARVMAMLKMLRAGFQQVVDDVGGMVGAKGPQVQHEIGEADVPGFNGRRVQ